MRVLFRNERERERERDCVTKCDKAVIHFQRVFMQRGVPPSELVCKYKHVCVVLF